jgi:hypothetical protein
MKKSTSFYRISVLIGLDFAQKGKTYGWITCLLLVAMLLMLVPILFYNTYIHQYQLTHYAAIPLVLVLGSSLYTSTALRDYANGKKGIFSLMAPASTQEKLFASLIVNLIFLIPFLFLFWTLHFQTISLANEQIPEDHTKYSAVAREVTIYFTYCYFLFNSVIFAGSIYFSKTAYFKTLICAIIGALVISYANTAFAKFLASYPMMMGAVPFGGWSLVRDSSLKVYQVNNSQSDYLWLYTLPALMVIGFWLVAYKRLQEKQL